jgi:glucosamine-6-phosphate deaminase
MDEYVGLSASHPASFRRYLHEHLLQHIQPGGFNPIGGDAPDAAAECRRYSALLDAAPIDLICLGIGENGHIAFNDPPVADFDDPVSAKIVELDLTCRQQQVNDGCYPNLDAVPKHAISLTIPVFRRAKNLSVVVPGPRKAAAVRATLRDPRSTACPATILREHPSATLFIDQASAALL